MCNRTFAKMGGGRRLNSIGALFNAQSDDRSSPATGFRRSVAKIDDRRRALENRSDYLSLNTDAFAVNDANKSNAAAPRFFEVVFNNRACLLRRDRVKIDDVPEFDYHRIWKGVVGVQ